MVAMNDTAFNPALIRVLLIVAFLVLSQFLRMRTPAKTTKPAPAGKQSPLELIREAMQQAKQQTQTRQSGQPLDQFRRKPGPTVDEFPMQIDQPQVTQDFRLGEQLQQPPSIQPESTFVPSLLLLALLACLFLMAYRYWAG